MQSLKKACPCGRNALHAGTSSANTSQPFFGRKHISFNSTIITKKLNKYGELERREKKN